MIHYLLNFINDCKRKVLLIAYKRMDVKNEARTSILISKDQVRSFALSFNNIKVFSDVKETGDTLFFRECNKHDAFEKFFDKQFASFCNTALNGMSSVNFSQSSPYRTKYNDKEIDKLIRLIKDSRLNRYFFYKFRTINFVLKKNKFSPWQGRKKINKSVLLDLGLCTDIVVNEDLLAYFLSYFKSCIIIYNFHSFIPQGDYETFAASRQIGSYKFAELLGLERCITPSYLSKVTIEEETAYGVLCERAGGVRGLDTNLVITPSLQCEFSNLKLLDALTWQVDHFANNYNIISGEDGEAYCVCAFDNDCDKTFFPSFSLDFISNRNGAPIVRKGMLNLPHLDKDTVDRLFSLKRNEVYSTMSPYLNKIQLIALWYRIHLLKRIITKTISEKPNVLLTKEQWSQDTIKEELGGSFGLTYTCQYVKRFEIDNAYLGGE